MDDSATLSRYLLHELPPREEEEVERRYFSDPQYLALLEAAEGDLIDAYVRNELTRAQRERFEQYFLCTRARRERLRMAEAMMAHLPQPKPRWRVAVLALAATLLLAVGLGAWLWTRTPATTTPVAQQQPVPPPPRIETPRAPVTASLALLPGLVRDASAAPQKLVLTPGLEQVRVSALVEVEGHWRDLHASLRAADGRELWSAAHLSLHDDRTVRMTIPAARLVEGEHLLVISADGEPLGDYPFVVEGGS